MKAALINLVYKLGLFALESQHSLQYVQVVGIPPSDKCPLPTIVKWPLRGAVQLFSSSSTLSPTWPFSLEPLAMGAGVAEVVAVAAAVVVE